MVKKGQNTPTKPKGKKKWSKMVEKGRKKFKKVQKLSKKLSYNHDKKSPKKDNQKHVNWIKGQKKKTKKQWFKGTKGTNNLSCSTISMPATGMFCQS